jgi:hypothetical protein
MARRPGRSGDVFRIETSRVEKQSEEEKSGAEYVAVVYWSFWSQLKLHLKSSSATAPRG